MNLVIAPPPPRVVKRNTHKLEGARIRQFNVVLGAAQQITSDDCAPLAA